MNYFWIFRISCQNEFLNFRGLNPQDKRSIGIFIWTLNPYDTIQFQSFVLSYAAYVTIHLEDRQDDRVDGRRDDRLDSRRDDLLDGRRDDRLEGRRDTA